MSSNGSSTTALLGQRSLPAQPGWVMALAILSIRFIQGFIYWGGGSRRFIYAPSKLNPHAKHWMAYKFQTAMPGALLGTDRLVAYLLHHFWLLYPAVILFSAAELFAGLFLIIGLFSRASAAVTIGLSFMLMLLFGWQGATCIDEWTMAAANFAMGITLFLAGGGAYAVDNLLLRRHLALATKPWFRWIAGSTTMPLGDAGFKRFALSLFWIDVAFSLLTYNYYRGSVISPYHEGPVSPAAHHWTLSQPSLDGMGNIRFHAYVDGGTPAVPSNVVEAALLDVTGKPVEGWNSAALAALPNAAFQNDFAYQRLHAGQFGIVGPVGAAGSVQLPGHVPAPLSPGQYSLRLTSVNSHVWELPLRLAPR